MAINYSVFCNKTKSQGSNVQFCTVCSQPKGKGGYRDGAAGDRFYVGHDSISN